uniref:Uncharacterized protein n=1 Tax=Anguilla anguilla TaxID=7936 RepID=A0A0E9P9H8_ANGAN
MAGTAVFRVSWAKVSPEHLVQQSYVSVWFLCGVSATALCMSKLHTPQCHKSCKPRRSHD